jgi:hypothetical protein
MSKPTQMSGGEEHAVKNLLNVNCRHDICVYNTSCY